ncbi:MAG: cupin [Planctomycetes bacterium]|nr:cupin [Planctomycetota bacterium]
MDDAQPGIQSAEVVLPCAELAETLAFFTTRLGFRVESIHPADDPSAALLSGHGLRLRLERGTQAAAGTLRCACSDPDAWGAREFVAPNGTRIEFVAARPPLVLPPLAPEFVVAREAEAPWHTGRAGMRYRDLLPGRLGGRFIASHIAIPEGGPVADYVHFHRVRFQLIYCRAGWVRVVYEDQGEPFVLAAGDCVLQPPEIRHQVLSSSAGLEVIEVSCPAEHETVADHALTLPTPQLRRERDFGGQRFVHHRAAAARSRAWSVPGFEARDLELAAASAGAVHACVVRPRVASAVPAAYHPASELSLLVVLAGALTLRSNEHGAQRLSAGDACALPPALAAEFVECSRDLELLEVLSPAPRL